MSGTQDESAREARTANVDGKATAITVLSPVRPLAKCVAALPVLAADAT